MYRWVEHTGELELEVEAESEEGVFAEALAAFAELLDGEAAGMPLTRRLRVEGRDRAILLADWLQELVFLAETLWEIPSDARPDMRVPARVFADEELLAAIESDQSLDQLQNVATLPGIVEAALAMPDIHQGYGFPVGGVAATELPDGVVSPGGVGYDINCGVRLLAAPFSADELGE